MQYQLDHLAEEPILPCCGRFALQNTYPRASDVNSRQSLRFLIGRSRNRIRPHGLRGFEAGSARSKDEAEVIAEVTTDPGEDGPC